MLDIIHTLWEEDAVPKFAEEPEAKTAVRDVLYGQLYGRPYRYGYRKSSEGVSASGSMDLEPEVSAPAHSTTSVDYAPAATTPNLRVVQPPTPVEDLEDILGAPLGG